MCKHCSHSEEDHVGYNYIDGQRVLIPGKLCFWGENQGYQEDFCICPGFEHV